MSLAKLKLKRAAAVAAGLCQVCCRVPAEPNRRRCEPCAQRHRNYQQGLRVPKKKRAKDDLWCIECSACGWHRGDCSQWGKS